MNQGNNNPDAPADVPVKRKRGRPRKHHSIGQGVNSHFPRLNYTKYGRVPKDQKLNHGVNVGAPPGFQETNGDVGVDPVVGQVVTGVVEASFGDGYLLNVRVGNSETTLRGVVFKPGCYIPVSRENDVAPNVCMVKRHEMSLPPENYIRAHRNGTHSAKGKLVPSVANPFMSRGNVVPVVLQPTDQPVDISNGLPLANQPSPVLSQTSLPFSSRVKQVPVVASKAPLQHEVAKVMATENNRAPQALHDTEMKSLEMSGMPMEKLLAEVIRRGQSHSQSAPQHTFGNMDQPLSIEPLQAVQPHQHNHSVSSTRPFEKERIGKMTELLQVVQERMTENRVVATSPLPNLDESQMPEKAGDDEAMH